MSSTVRGLHGQFVPVAAKAFVVIGAILAAAALALLGSALSGVVTASAIVTIAETLANTVMGALIGVYLLLIYENVTDRVGSSE